MFAMSIGTIAMVDLRMLGVGFKHQTPEQLQKDISIWTLVGLIIVITSGFVIWTTDPLRYYYNWSFRYKIIALVAAHHLPLHDSSQGGGVTTLRRRP